MNFAPHPFSLRQLQYAIAVADTLSFRQAAARCGVSQPSLSVQLAQLEEVLGVQLFERDRRRVLSTAAGEALVERARRLLRDADDLMAAAARAQDPFVGTMRIGVIPTISSYLLPSTVPALRQTYPKLPTVWIEDKTEVLVDKLADGSLDAAIMALEAEIGDVEVDVLASDPFVLTLRPSDPLAESTAPVKVEELAGADILLLDDGHCFRDQALSLCSQANVRELEFRATSLSTLAQMVAGGLGLTLLPRLAVPTETQRAELVVRHFAAPQPARTVVLAWRRGSPLGDAFRQLSATLREAYPTGDAPATGTAGCSTLSP